MCLESAHECETMRLEIVSGCCVLQRKLLTLCVCFLIQDAGWRECGCVICSLSPPHSGESFIDCRFLWPVHTVSGQKVKDNHRATIEDHVIDCSHKIVELIIQGDRRRSATSLWLWDKLWATISQRNCRKYLRQPNQRQNCDVERCDVAALNTGAKHKQTVLPWRQNTCDSDNEDNPVESMAQLFFSDLFFLLFALQQNYRTTSQWCCSAFYINFTNIFMKLPEMLFSSSHSKWISWTCVQWTFISCNNVFWNVCMMSRRMWLKESWIDWWFNYLIKKQY